MRNRIYRLGFLAAVTPMMTRFFIWPGAPGADALVSCDQAVLSSRGKARKFGFEIYDVPKMVTVLGAGPSVITSSTQLSSLS